MSAILIAAFNDHATATALRTRLVHEGFPTDRISLTSRDEPGQAGLIPKDDFGSKLTEHFRTLLQTDYSNSEDSIARLRNAVLEGKAVVAVQPRGDTETQQALQMFNDAGPISLHGVDLENQPLEHAATEKETPVLTWMGKVLAGPGAPDTTGVPKLPSI